jgi:hypothetical protein
MLVMVFVLVLVAGMAAALFVTTRNELEMAQADAQTKQAFFTAESGLEGGRASMVAATFDINASLTTAAGSDGAFDFDPQNIRPVYDGNGKVTSFTGYGDDVPLQGPSQLGSDGAMYISFLTNDPVDAVNPDPRIDTNERVVITGIGTGVNGAVEIVQTLVEPDPLLPSIPPCTVTLLGPTPDYYGGLGTCPADEQDEGLELPLNKTFWGTDCAGSGGIAGLFVPTVCAQGCADAYELDEDEYPDDILDCADTIVEIVAGNACNNEYVSGPFYGDDTIADFNNPNNEPTIGPIMAIDEEWLHCDEVVEMLEQARIMADFKCSGNDCSLSSSSGWNTGSAPALSPSTITFVDGDLTVTGSESGTGMLWVTGQLSFDVGAAWSGPLLVIGEGRFVRTGTTGGGLMSGATVVANVAGVDGIYGNADDCVGGSLGFHSAMFHEADGETEDTVYCTDDLTAANPMWTYEVTQFRQR